MKIESRLAAARSVIAVSMIAAAMLLQSAPAQAQSGDEVVRPFACLTYSLTETMQTGPFARQAPPPGCSVAAAVPVLDPARAMVPPGAPTGLTARVDGRTVVLRWTAPAGHVRSYVVLAGSTSGVVNVARFDTESTMPTLTVPDVPDGTFFFRALAQTDSGVVSAASNEVGVRVGKLRFTKDCAYRTPPPSTALTVNYLPGPIVRLDWRAGEEGDCQAVNPVTRGYEIEVAVASGAEAPFQFLPIGDLGGRTTWTSPLLAGINGTFYVWIRGIGDAGSGGPSNEVIVVLGNAAAGAPSTPSNVTGTAAGASFVVTWDEVSSPVSNRATSSTITVDPPIPGLGGSLGAGAPIITSGGRAIGLYRASGIPAGVYTFQVQGRNSAGSSGVSSRVTLTLSGPANPAAPVGVHSFTGVPDGGNFSTVTAGSGVVFGTTSSGGLLNPRCRQDRDGCGTLFSNGSVYRIIHRFSDSDVAPGGSGYPATYPRSQLLLTGDGNLWGTTVGQEFTNPNGGGAAVAYKVEPTSGATTIVAELGGPSFSRLFQATNGRIYGTTQTNGPGSCAYISVPRCSPSAGSGTVWYVTASGGPATYIHTFTGPDGASPYGGVMQGADGMLFGMTSKGGAFGLGTIYRINPADNSFTKIYDFPGGSGGASPLGELIQFGSTFYGTTECGGDLTNTPIYCAGTDGNGTAAGKGTIFSMTVSGNSANVNILHVFTGRIQETGEAQLTQAYDGVLPTANLTLGPDGRLYGVTNGGGSFGAGIAFAMTTGGGFTQLYTFGGGDAGGGLNATLVLVGNTLIGSGQYGGQFNYGAVFSFTVPSGFPAGQ